MEPTIEPATSAIPPKTTPSRPHARKQLSNSMQHIRYAVAVSPNPHSSATTPPASDNPSPDPSVYGVPGTIQPIRKPRTDSSLNPEKRSDPFQFGSRYLEEGDDIFAYNAWDHVETDEAYRTFAEEMYERQRSEPVSEFDKSTFTWSLNTWLDGL